MGKEQEKMEYGEMMMGEEAEPLAKYQEAEDDLM